MRALQLFVPVVLTVLLSAGCAGDDAREAATPDAGGEAHEVAIESEDNAFVPSELEVPAGPVALTVDNTGDAVHNLVNEELGVVMEADGGEQATATFSARPGTYELLCTYHESQGMTATLTVSE